MTYKTVSNQTTLEQRGGTLLAIVGVQKHSMVRPVNNETNRDGVAVVSAHKAADYVSSEFDGSVPLAAFTGTPGGFVPIGSNFADLATIQGSGLVMDPEMDTKGHFIVLEDASECHFRLATWTAGKTP